MPEFEIGLGVKEINGLIRELERYNRKLDKAANRIVRELALEAKNDMTVALASIVDKDGNVRASVRGKSYENPATISLTGDQAAYLEFGTGVIGRNSPHELAGQVGWEYCVGPKIRTFKNGRIGWLYYDNSNRHYRITSGIAAQNIVFNAARNTRYRVKDVVKGALG